ncbi:MAG: helix-hairpin-helix domain-containing protein [Calditrichae bacterium]|nr:helix-hairpin-helix domain-containing protein [Calditrichota bacterium]MCB9057430.1 helix-hairpin-helix domain-containing protein [Calditrichia bacterium]
MSLVSELSENETYLSELVLELKQHPVNINTAEKNDLQKLPFISASQIDSIIKMRSESAFKSKREIRKILGKELYDFLKDMITISGKTFYPASITQRNTYKVEKLEEIESGKYAGNALYNYTRFKYQYDDNLDIGIVIQKDPGESSYTDHFNFSANYRNENWQIIAGNYFVQFGSGLIQSNPYGTQKSIYIPAIFRESSQIARSNLTSSESTGKFGLFLNSTLLKSLSVFAFYSAINRDVSMEDDFIVNFRQDGYHRTASEINTKERLSEKNWGSGFYYSLSQFRLGFLYNAYDFYPGIENTFEALGDSQKRRQFFAFNGRHLSQMAFSLDGNIANINVSGEYSFTKENGRAFTQSFFYDTEKLDFGIRFWSLDNNFQTIDGRSFDNSGLFPRGVQGYFSGIRFKPVRNFSFSAFKVFEKETWRTYFESMPTQSDEWLAQADWHQKEFGTSLRFRKRTTEEFTSKTIQLTQKSIRFECIYNTSHTVRLKTRAEHTFFDNLNEKGTLVFQDVSYDLREDIMLNGRFSLFKTSSYESRIYEFENDLPGSFSNLALFDDGNKFYILLKWQLADNFSSWLKWRYIVKYAHLENGQNYRILDRDLRMQFAFSF